MIKLSDRLSLVFTQLIPQQEVWDLCCDHGYLGLKAIESGLFSQVYFVDQASHLTEKIHARLVQKGWSQRGLCLGVPAEEISQPVTGSVVIAGIGGVNLRDILQHLVAKPSFRPQRLILGPHRDEGLLADYLKNLAVGPVRELEITEGPRRRRFFILDFKDDLRTS